MIRPLITIGPNALTIVREGALEEEISGMAGVKLPLVLIGPALVVERGAGAIIATRGEALALASALQAVAPILPLE